MTDRAPQTGVNWLVEVLPAREAAAVRAELEPVNLPIRHSLYEVDQPITEVWFPTDCVASLVADMPDGKVVEVATVGREGLLGLPVFLGSEIADTRVFIQVAGSASKMPTAVFLRLARELASFNRLLGLYVEALFLQVSRSAACNQVHSIDQRTARWLLMTHDRVGRDDFFLTQEFLAQMLGIRRAGVSKAASRLQKAGLIRYRRGQVSVVDWAGLQATSCGCYALIRDRYDDLLRP